MIPRIKKLIVLGGPKCVGKSRLMRKCINLKSHMLHDDFKVNEDSWELLILRQIEEGYKLQHSNLVLHYDFIRPIMRGLNGYGEDVLLPIMERSEQIELVTMWCSNIELISRVDLRHHLAFKKLTTAVTWCQETDPMESKMQWLKRLYHSRQNLWMVYKKWFKFIEYTQANYWAFESSLENEELIGFSRLDSIVGYMRPKFINEKIVINS